MRTHDSPKCLMQQMGAGVVLPCLLSSFWIDLKFDSCAIQDFALSHPADMNMHPSNPASVRNFHKAFGRAKGSGITGLPSRLAIEWRLVHHNPNLLIGDGLLRASAAGYQCQYLPFGLL